MRADFSEFIFLALFIGFSIISSLMNEKKKKQKQQNVKKPERRPEPRRVNPFQDKEEVKDIFDLMFSNPGMMKQPERQAEKPEIHLEEVDTGDNAAIDDRLLKSRNAAEKIKFEMEQALHSRMSHPTEKNYKTEIPQTLDLIKPSMSYSKTPVNKRVSEIRKKIHNFNSLKDFIIISEIIGKPKALRR